MKITLKTIILPTLAILGVGLAVRAQFTPGSGGSFTVPRPVVPVPSTPPAPTGPVYSWELPTTPQPTSGISLPPYPQPQQPVVTPSQPDMVRIVSGPVIINGVEYIATPQGYMPRISDAQLGDLTASIALYPDPLLATMLPAATLVEELTYAEKWMAQHPGADERAINNLSVDDSVKTLMHYPTVLAMMTDHLDWTQALGLSFLYQRNDLMESIQRWRSLAVSYGTLASTPQIDVFQQGSSIIILPPPRAQTIYVPVYNPQVVFVRPVRPVPVQNVLTFSAGGFSLSFIDNDLDWRGHTVRVPVRHDWDGPGRGGDRGGPGGDRGGPGGDRGGRGDPGRGGSGGDRGGSGGGRAGSSVVVTPDKPTEKKEFVRDTTKSAIVLPDRIVTPADKKVVTIPAATKPAPTLPTPPGRGGPGGGR